MPIVKSNTTAEIWAEMANNYHLEQAGPQTTLTTASTEASATGVVEQPAAPAVAVAENKAAGSGTPNPAIPFAILRNAHEGLRAG